MRVIVWLFAALVLSQPVHPAGSSAIEWNRRVRAADEARSEGRRETARDLYRSVVTEAAGIERPLMPVARALDALADLERDAGRHADAEALYRRVLPMWGALLGPGQARLAVTWHNLGVVCAAQQRHAEAREALARALEIWGATLGEDSSESNATRRLLERIPPG